MTEGSASEGVLVPESHEKEPETTISAQSTESSEPHETTTTHNTSPEQSSGELRNSLLQESLIPNTIDPVVNSLKILQNSDSGYIASQRESLRLAEEIERNSIGLTEQITTQSDHLDGSVTSAESTPSDSEKESSENGQRLDSTQKTLKKTFREGGAPNYYLEKKIAQVLTKDARASDEKRAKFRKIVKVVTRAVQGIPKTVIAQETGLAVTTIGAWTKQYQAIIDELSEIETYKTLRADVLAAIQSRIARSIPDKVEDADLPQLTRAFDVLSKYERLERGLSTDNKRLATTTVNIGGPEDDNDN